MAALNESRLSAIDNLARSRMTALDRVVLELVAEVRRLRQQAGEEGSPPAA